MADLYLPISYLTGYPNVLARMLSDRRGYLLLSRESPENFWISPACPPIVTTQDAPAMLMRRIHQVLSTELVHVSRSAGNGDSFVSTTDLDMTDMLRASQSIRAQVEVLGDEYWLLWLTCEAQQEIVISNTVPEPAEELQDIVEVLQLGTWKWHIPSGRVVIDQTYAQMLGYTLEELEPLSIETWQGLIMPEDVPMADAAMRRHLADVTEDYYCEVRFQHKTGRTVWIADQGRVIRWTHEGEPEWMVGAHQDISVRRIAEEQFRISTARLELALKSAEMGTMEYSPSLHTIRLDSRLVHMLELDPTQFMEGPFSAWLAHLLPADRIAMHAAMDEAYHSPGKILRASFGFIDRSGKRRYFHWQGSAYTYGLAKETRVLGMVWEVTEAHEREQQFQWAHTMLLETNQLARVGGWEYDLTTDQLNWTAITCAIHEVPPSFQPSVGTALNFYAPGSSRDAIQEAWDKLQQAGTPFDLELQIITFRGHLSWVRVQGKAVYQRGEIVKLYGAFQDIDVQRKAQDLFLEQNKKLQNITTALEQSAVVSVTDVDGRILRVNPLFCEISGYSREELLGKNHSMLNSGFHDKPFWEAFWAQLNTGNPWQGEICNLNSQGEYYWMYVIVNPIIDRHGQLQQYLSIQFPITDRKRMEVSLVESEKSARKLALQYETILESRSMFLISMDEDGICHYANSSYQNAWGSHAVKAGGSFLSMVPEEMEQQVLAAWDACLHGVRAAEEVILPAETESGEIRQVKWEFRAIRVDADHAWELLAVGVDITAMVENLARSEMLLRTTTDQNYRLKSFTYITSHNIRSHAANISSIVQFLSREQKADARESLVEMLIVATHQLNQTIADVNHILTINDTKLQDYGPCSLYNLAEQTLQSLSGLIESERAQVTNSLPKEVTVHGIDSYVRSILFHLVTNALKYRRVLDTLKIDLRLSQQDQYQVLEVEDNGLGIDLNRYGDKMFTMYKTFHGNEDARGFGLFLIRNQIEAMQGKIEVESIPGKGSTFKVYFLESH